MFILCQYYCCVYHSLPETLLRWYTIFVQIKRKVDRRKSSNLLPVVPPVILFTPDSLPSINDTFHEAMWFNVELVHNLL